MSAFGGKADICRDRLRRPRTDPASSKRNKGCAEDQAAAVRVRSSRLRLPRRLRLGQIVGGGTSPLDSTAAWIPEAETPSRYPTTVSAVGLAGFAGSAGLAGSTAGRDRHCQSAKAVSPLRLGARHQSRLARAGDRRGGLGAGARTVAAFCCDAI